MPTQTHTPTLSVSPRAFSFYFRRQWYGWALALLSILLAAILQLRGLGLYQPLIDIAEHLALHPEKQTIGMQGIVMVLGAIITSVVLSNLLYYRAYALIAQMTQRVAARLRVDFQTSTLQQGPNFHRQHSVGELLTVGTNDVETINIFFTQEFPQLASVMVQIVLTLMFMGLLNWELTLGSVGLAAALFSFSRAFGGTLRQRARHYNQQLAQANSSLNENLAGARDIQLFGQAARMTHQLQARLDSMGRLQAGNMDLFYLNNTLTHVISMLGLAFVYGWGAQGVIRATVQVGLLVSFAAYFSQFIGALRLVSNASIKIQGMRLAAQRVLAIVTLPPEIADRPGARDPGPLRGHIRFEDVAFSYEPEKPEAWRIRDVTLEILPGEKVAIVGGSGSGKSTLFQLVMRFYEVTSGRITIDGHDVRDLPLAALRRNFAWVAQNVVLFQGTLADNIRFGKPEASDAEVQAAAGVASVTEFVDKLDQGYQTELGALGQGLSGGQKQRVSIARAALVNPPIMVLDEATSALDKQSEGLVTRALDQLTRDSTALVITHRLETIRNADKIVVLDTDEYGHGIVRAVGTHESLMENTPQYAALVGKARRKGILMPIGPQYDTTAALPTVLGLAQSFGAPVYLLDFGPLPDTEAEKNYGITLVPVKNVFAANVQHAIRVNHVERAIRAEGIAYEHIIPPDPTLDWVENTLLAIDQTDVSHLVATDNVMIPMDKLRESIQKIQRKSAVEYVLVNPIPTVD